MFPSWGIPRELAVQDCPYFFAAAKVQHFSEKKREKREEFASATGNLTFFTHFRTHSSRIILHSSFFIRTFAPKIRNNGYICSYTFI
jgi:hypothetical protein